jgi:anti-anti-sigma factor
VDIASTRAEVLVFGDEALVAVHGELDLYSIDVLTRALAEAPKVSRVVIDLQEVSFLDYAALRRIEALARDFAAAGRILRLDHASGLVNRLIDIMRLDDLRVR